MFQVSNWFINARVRLWKPMVEDMYQQELKEGEGSGEEDNREKNQSSSNNSGQLASAQTPTPSTTASNTTTTPPPTSTTTPTTPTGKRSDYNAIDNDPSLTPIINTQTFSENQVNQQQQQHYSSTTTTTTTILATTASEVVPPVSDLDLPPPHNNRSMVTDDTCRHGSFVTAEYGTTSAASDIGSTLIRFGTTSGDVSLTLGLRHAGNMPEKTPFSLRDFGGI